MKYSKFEAQFKLKQDNISLKELKSWQMRVDVAHKAFSEFR